METNHRIIIGDSTSMTAIEDRSIDLVVTSPPYPMIQMWDDIFCEADPAVKEALRASDPDKAFERMHLLLDKVWMQVRRVMKPGGIVCINIGDATRTIADRFRLFGNHARIISSFRDMGFDQLPAIIWRKTTNAPNKFMGSGMYPPGAYVTLEHEYILIFRNGAMREFLSEEKKNKRRESAYFWEERNAWFSDVWFNLIGTRQATNGKSRERSAAFPFDLPYRLVNMFSVKGDAVLDPFLGTGTTMLAAMACARHSVGYEIDAAFQKIILERVVDLPEMANQVIEKRVSDHELFIQERIKNEKEVKNHNKFYNFPVITRQEADLRFDLVQQVQFIGNDRFKVSYGDHDRKEPKPAPIKDRPKTISKSKQLSLF